MKKNAFLVSTLLLTLSITVHAQDWVKMMSDPKANFYDVQKAFNEWNEQREQSKDAGVNGNESEEKDGNYQLYKRWEWYMQPRSYPSGNLPAANLSADNYNLYKKQKTTDRTAQAQSSAAWTYAGNTSVPNNGGDGRVNRIIFYPGNDSIIFACTPFGGLWKSTNAGASWSTNTDLLPSIAVSDLAINPLNPKVMYLATGDGDGWDQATIGLLKSTDGGNTWDTTGLFYTLQASGPAYYIGTRVLINPSDTSLILAGASNGLFLSRNGGLTWTQTINDDIKSVEFEPFHSSTVYVGSYNGTYYRSTDSGATFTKDTVGLPISGVGRLTVAVSPADSNVVYVLAENSSSSGFFGLYMSTDRGQTFKPRSLFSSNGGLNLLGWASAGNDSTGQGWYTLSLAVSPTNIDTVLVGGVNIWMSSDSGRRWSLGAQWTGTGAPYVHADIHEIVFSQGSGAKYYTCCDGGVFTKRAAYAGNWTDISNNLEIGQQYSIGLSSSTPGYWISGWQDNGTNVSTSPWKQVIGGDGMVCFIDYTGDNYLYGSYQNGALRFSSDGGFSWSNAAGSITETGPWTTRWLEDPAQPGYLFAGFKNVWQSGTYGQYWGLLSSWGTGQINSLVVSPLNDQYIYASQGNKVYGTSSGGVVWNDISPGLPLGLASCSALAIDPNNPNHIWATFSGWVSTVKVYESHNGGTSWHNITTGLPNLPVNCIVPQIGGPEGIYIGTDIGVYYHDTILNSWISYNNGLPNVMVDDLKIFAPANTLVAATYGRGTWNIPTHYLVGLNEVSFDKNIKVYPNPTSGKLSVKFDMLSGDYFVSITNLLGQNLNTNKVSISGEYTYNMDLSGYSKGVYFIEVSNGSSKMVKKVVVY
jgi:hypothetical protein